MKTDALPGCAAVVVVVRHPAHRGVVSAEFGERRRAGNGIRHVIVAAVGMREMVFPANRAGATLKPYDLAFKAMVAGLVRLIRNFGVVAYVSRMPKSAIQPERPRYLQGQTSTTRSNTTAIA